MRRYMETNKENIITRKPFKADTIKGYETTNGYCVDSYSTTIACYSNESKTWYLTNERFSQTTSTQQSALRLILPKYVTLSPDMFNAQVREMS